MKRLFSIITIVCGMVTVPTFADEYSNPMARDNYVGVRVHKNENIAFPQMRKIDGTKEMSIALKKSARAYTEK